MDKNKYNSLTSELIQNGILFSQENKENEGENFFANSSADNPFNISDEKNIKENKQENKKRINNYDLELLNNLQENSEKKSDVESIFKLLLRFLNFKQTKIKNGSGNFFETIIFRLFPRVYKIKIAKDALVKLKELNIDTKKLFEKTIPYGEREIRYKDLIKYLQYANEIQTRLKKKF